jgi:predicted transcriptional regulator of viral defense system
MGNVDVRVFERCRTQRGLVTLSQLHADGLTEKQIRTRVQRGWLVRADTNVFRHVMAESSWEQKLLIAVLAAGPGALAARRSASRLWGVTNAPSPRIEVVVRRWTRRPITSGQLIESTDLRQEDIALIDGIPVTSVPRTIIDCAAKVGPHRLLELADNAVHQRLTTYEEILDRFVRLARRGRPGVVRTREMLEQRLGVEIGTDLFEQMVLEIVAEYGLPLPIPQFPVIVNGEKYFLDLAWPAVKRFVECDGWDTHALPQAITSDDLRQNDLVLAGWKPLRFSWHTVKYDRPVVARQIAMAMTGAA